MTEQSAMVLQRALANAGVLVTERHLVEDSDLWVVTVWPAAGTRVSGHTVKLDGYSDAVKWLSCAERYFFR